MQNLRFQVTGVLVASILSLALTGTLWTVFTVSAQPLPSAIIVTSTNDNGPGSLRAALAAAHAGDVVQFSLPPTSTIILTSGELPVSVPIVIDGSTALNLTVSGNHASRVLAASAPLTIAGLTIANGNTSGDGGGIATTSAITLSGVSVVNNSAGSRGGGLFAEGAVVLINSLFRDNISQNGGGGLRVHNTLEMKETLVLSNTTKGQGGGAYALGMARLDGGAFENNRVNFGCNSGRITCADGRGVFEANGVYYSHIRGGGLYAYKSLEISGTTFISNSIDGAGGGVFVEGEARLTGGLFQYNWASFSGGGGIYVNNRLEMSGTTFISNSVYGAGGGIFVEGEASLRDGLFQRNSAAGFGGGFAAKFTADLQATQFISNSAGYDGGGADILGTATLQSVLFQGNHAENSGGGLHVWTAFLTDTHFSNNVSDFGGGLVAQGTTIVRQGRIEENRASVGGGLYATNSLELLQTQFLGNFASLWGGGIYFWSPPGAGESKHPTDKATVINSLFARNTALESGSALYLNAAASDVKLAHVTIGVPMSTTRSAVTVITGSLDVKDTIIVSHSIGLENSGGLVAQDFNLFFGNQADVQGDIPGGEHNVNGDPRFVNVSLDDYHLGVGSAALDAGVDVGTTSDFDGDLRPDGGGFDIGFDEQAGNIRRIFLSLIRK